MTGNTYNLDVDVDIFIIFLRGHAPCSPLWFRACSFLVVNAISTLLFNNTDHADALYGWKRVDNDQLASEEDRCIGFMKHG